MQSQRSSPGTALTLVPATGLASAPASQAKAASPTRTREANATTGVVKSINDTTLVITRSGKPATEMTFDVSRLDPS